MSTTISVWGAAPSLVAMKEMRKRGQKKLFVAGEFWYHFRVYIPYIAPVIFIIFMISAICGWNTVEGHLVFGSIVSLFSTLAVIGSYWMIIPWRKHPSILILYRSITSMIFSVNIILNSISDDKSDQRGFAFVTEFMLILGECWLTTIAVDLVHSLTNPFISYKYNLKRFQAYNLTFTLLLSIIFFFHKDCQGSYESICWVKVDSTSSSPCLWGYYFAWILLMYAYQIWATLFAIYRLRKGLSSTFDMRKQCANDTFKCLSVYAVYLSMLVLFFIIISSRPDPRPDAPINNFALVLLYFIANRGFVDGIAWFMLHDFHRSELNLVERLINYIKLKVGLHVDVKSFSSQDASSGGDKNKDTNNDDDDLMDEEAQREFDRHLEARARSGTRTMSIAAVGESVRDGFKDIRKDLKKGLGDVAAAALEEYDEADLSPQMNIALRQQVVQYVTMGVKLAITTPDPPPIEKSFMREFQEFIYPVSDYAAYGLDENMIKTEYVLDNLHPFMAFAPRVFKKLREQEGISEEKYLKTLQSTANERLSEGASGAFMFFCGGGEFIVKTIRDREARVLHRSLRKYASYLKKNRNSLLCRFLGSYSLAMYEQTFFFVVMLNCFDPKAKINERYDIKGSWVGRSADLVKPTKKVVCRHCNELFIPAAKEQCGVIVGRHEANVVLKDNDLRSRISLRPEDAKDVVAILKNDSDLLGELGVLDYSLLVGVKKGKFEIRGESVVNLARSNSAEFRQDHGASIGSAGEGNSHNSPPHSQGGSVASSRGAKAKFQSTFYANQVIGPSIYHLGIVDFLQDWTFDKEIERNFKIYVNRKDPEGVSVMEPIAYKIRFQNKMDQIFELDDEAPTANTPLQSTHLLQPILEEPATVVPTRSSTSEVATTSLAVHPTRARRNKDSKNVTGDVMNPLFTTSKADEKAVANHPVPPLHHDDVDIDV